MTTAASQSKDVAIVGGGVAGLTCALRLSERGYKVTLYERTPVLGGNLSSEFANGMYYDVYPHLFCDWYVNFWQIVEEDLGIKRAEAFEPQMGVKVVQDPDAERTVSPAPAAAASAKNTAKEQPTYQDLKNASTLQNIWGNLFSGVLSPPDMFLLGFAFLDLASQPFDPSKVLERQTVDGFLYSRRYATEGCADLLDLILMEIWSIPSDDTSANAYKDFVRPGLRFSSGMPFAWLLRGSLEEMLMKPWRQKLIDAGCDIKTAVEVTCINLTHDHKVELRGEDDTIAQHTNVVLAVPATELARLVMTADPGRRIVDKVPKLLELQRLRMARILVVTVWFTQKLPNIPRETVGLAGSKGYLTFLDISQLWTRLSNKEGHPTVLVLAASDEYAYPSKDSEEWAHMMIKELARYLPAVKPGAHWGAPDSNIDYSKSWCKDNYGRRLFLNDVSTDRWQPEAYYEQLPGVFFAGDFCVNDVKMATIEATVISGLEAAGAVQMRAEGKSDIAVGLRTAPSVTELLTMKLGLLPLAYGAAAWSTVNVALSNLAKGKIIEGTTAPLMRLSLIPLNYLTEWVGTIDALGMNSVSPADGRYVSRSSIQGALGLAAQGLLAAGDYLRQVASGVSLEETDKFPTLRSLLKGVVRAVDKGLQEPPPSPRAARERPVTAVLDKIPEAAAVLTDPRWAFAVADFINTLRSAIDPGTGYRSRSEYVRRHRAKP
jgi:predicted NAD/FAD-dependent oxidoreductase